MYHDRIFSINHVISTFCRLQILKIISKVNVNNKTVLNSITVIKYGVWCKILSHIQKYCSFLPELSHLSWEVAKSCHFLALQKILLLESNQFNFIHFFVFLPWVLPIFVEKNSSNRSLESKGCTLEPHFQPNILVGSFSKKILQKL